MAVRLELGLDLGESFSGQRIYRFAIAFTHGLDSALRAELEQLLESWYYVAFFGGFGGSLNELDGVRYEAGAEGTVARFSVIGVLRREALDVLLRCLDCDDFDAAIDYVSLNAAAEETG